MLNYISLCAIFRNEVLEEKDINNKNEEDGK